jgi:hypothetical protein
MFTILSEVIGREANMSGNSKKLNFVSMSFHPKA